MDTIVDSTGSLYFPHLLCSGFIWLQAPSVGVSSESAMPRCLSTSDVGSLDDRMSRSERSSMLQSCKHVQISVCPELNFVHTPSYSSISSNLALSALELHIDHLTHTHILFIHVCIPSHIAFVHTACKCDIPVLVKLIQLQKALHILQDISMYTFLCRYTVIHIIYIYIYTYQIHLI